MIDYALWEVIENGATLPITKVVEGVITEMPITTAKEKAQRRLEVKARSTLMMGIPNEHQLKFNSIKDAKKLLKAVEKRFGGNAATKKTQRNLLKQQYENFTAPSSKILDQTFNRLQKLLKFKHTKHGNETIGFDKSNVECYNCQKRGHFARECRAPTNQDNKNKESSRRSVHVETFNSTALVSYDGLGGYDWSDQAEEGPNYALMAFLSLIFDSKISNDSTCLETVKLLKSQNDQLLKDLKKYELMVLGYKTAIRELRKKLEIAQKEKDGIKLNVDKFKHASKSLNKLIKCQLVDNCKNGLGYENYNAVSPPYIGNFMHLTRDLSFTGLDEFVNKPVVENYKAKSSEEEPKVVRKNDDPPIIKEYVSDNEEEDVSQPKIKNKTVKPSIAKIEFIKSKQQEKTARKTVKHGNLQMDLHDQGVIDSRCSRHMTGNMSYLINYKEIDEGYVAFGGNHKGEKITGKDHLGKFDGKADEGFFVRYSLNSKTFRVFNSRTRIVEENLHIRFSKSTPNVVGSGPNCLFDIDALTRIINYEPIVADPKSSNDDVSKPLSDDGKKVDEYPRKENECNDQEKKDNVNNTNNVNTISSTVNTPGTNRVNAVGKNISIELQFDPNIPALEDVSTYDFSSDDEDDGAVADMNNLDTTIQEKLLQFKLHEVWTLVDLPNGKRDIGTKWGFRNKKDERGIMIRNKARLVAQGYTQEEGIDYDEVFAPVIEEEMYVCQPPRFEDADFLDRVYKVKNHYMDYIKLLKLVYVDDIIFGSTKKELCNAFEKLMHEKFQMSSIGELTFFLGLQKFRFIEVKTASTPIETQKPLLKDKDGEEVDVHMYRYQVNSKVLHIHAVKKIFSDYAGASLDRKTMTGGCEFLGCRLISWQCKKQTVVANSTIEAEYVAASSCCGDFNEKKLIQIVKIHTDKNVADLLTKAFDFWSTAMAKTINGEAQLYTKVDGKKIIVTESFVTRNLRLADEEGIGCLLNSTIFEQIALMEKPIRKDTQVPQPSGPTEFVEDEAVYKEWGDRLVRTVTTASSLETEHDSGNITKTQSKATPNEPSFQRTDSGGGPRCQEIIGGWGTTTQTRVLDLEKTKTTQHNKIASLKKRVKKLEKKNRSRTYRLKRLYKVGLIARVESFGDEESLGEDASKQWRRIDAIDADEDITLVSVQDDVANEMFDVDMLDGEEMFIAGQNENAVEEVVDAAKVSTTATTVTITTKEITLAQALEALKTSKPKVKGIVFQDLGKSIATTTIYSQQSHDKGKGIMIEELVKPKKKDQIRLDEEAALKFQAALKLQDEFNEEEGLKREKAEKEQEANIALIEEWDDIQAKIDADHQLAERLQAQEQEELSDAENATLFQQLLEKGRKHFTAKRAEEKRNKPPTKAQQRKIIAFRRVNTFEDFKTELVKGKEKRAGKELIQESTKKQKSEMKTMFKPYVEDEVWKMQQGYKVLEWKMYESCGVHSLMMQSMLIYMLVEKKYPFTPPTLSMMLEKKLQIDCESKMAYQLCKLIKKKLKK
uniref:CCHC-type domain-containing protein n=1 Tax=Tanacetum cinerariifolium TaxID=118510 RepID=A0A6L2KMJ0_TANCI|nr:hypothetical protein [Tanacetum cinerariifolium]